MNTLGMDSYFGPCPDAGDTPHHYEFLLLALDYAPGELETGLDWASLKAKANEHTLGAASLVGRYAKK